MHIIQRQQGGNEVVDESALKPKDYGYFTFIRIGELRDGKTRVTNKRKRNSTPRQSRK